MIYFIHLPRTGGTFISQYARHKLTKLSKQFNYWPPGYKRGKKFHAPATSIPDYKSHFLWGLVRNPYDWYVSQYFYFAGKEKNIVEGDIFTGVDGGYAGPDFVERFPTFGDWIHYGVESQLKYFWLSNLYDYMFLDDKGEYAVNFVGLFEHMNLAFDIVLTENGLTPRVQLKDFWGNKNASKHNHYREYYNEELKKIIQDKDSKIINKYGYIF